MRPGPVVCIVGPTASGKSALAELVADHLGSEVVSVDAMQVYRGMDVGTAKTPPQERRVPLRMVDVADPGENYSVRLFQRDARRCVDELLARGVTPVLAGGTGLYLNAVIDEMEFPAGERDAESRHRYEALLESEGPQALYDLLVSRDAQSAALIHPNNSRRIIRALEMLDDGTSYVAQHDGLHRRAPHYSARIWGLTLDRDRLYRRIDERVDEMMARGLLEEVRGLVGRGLTPDMTSGQAIGYKEILEALEGRVTLDEAVKKIKLRSRRYAKRQLSWFRHDGRVRWIDLDAVDLDAAAQMVIDDLGEVGDGEV